MQDNKKASVKPPLSSGLGPVVKIHELERVRFVDLLILISYFQAKQGVILLIILYGLLKGISAVAVLCLSRKGK